MTQKLTYSIRIANGVNSLERSIILGCLELHQVTKAVVALKDNVKLSPVISPAATETTLTFGAQIDLTLDSAIAIGNSFDLIQAVVNYANTENPAAIDPVNPLTGLIEELPEEPIEVVSLEQYILWAGLVLANSTYPESKYFALSYPEEANPYKIRLTFKLPLDYRKHLAGANYLESSIKVFNYHITDIDQLPGSPFVIPPSPQFWGDPVADVTALKALSGVTVGTTRWLTEKQAFYTLVSALPNGTTADNDLWIVPTTQSTTEVWKKGGTGSGGGTNQTAAQIRDALVTLAGAERLPATAIKDLPSNGSPGADGKNPEFQFSVTHLQYRLIGDTNWLDLIPIVDIQGDQGLQGIQGATGSNGKNIELQKSTTHLQWRLVGDTTWLDLVLLADLKGEKGDAGASGENWIDTAVKTTDYTANDTERIPVDSSSGIVNITAPASGRFWVYDIAATSINTGFGLHSCNILPNSTETIRGATSYEIDRAGASVIFRKINNNWVTLNHG